MIIYGSQVELAHVINYSKDVIDVHLRIVVKKRKNKFSNINMSKIVAPDVESIKSLEMLKNEINNVKKKSTTKSINTHFENIFF
jgi:hypothetical protein